MKTTATGKRVLTLAASAGVLALVLSGCGRAAEAPPKSGASGSAAAAEPSPGITDDHLTLGISTPLTGNTAGPGNCTADGAIAYFGMKNDEGGFEFGDGKTRTVELKEYDDQYDPEKAVGNFQQMVADGVFGAALSLGTPTNRAWRDAAAEEGFPQVLVMTGDPIFSNREDGYLTLGLVPTYQQEGAAFGKALAADGQAHKVGILFQNDDYGKGYSQGFKDAIKGSKNIEVVKELSYEPSATSLEGQITELQATGADVLFHAVSITPLAIADLQKVASLGWKPTLFLPSNTASPGGILKPAGVAADTFTGVYAAGFAQAAAAPPFAESEAGKKYFDAIAKYVTGHEQDGKSFPHCVWSWTAAQILEEAFKNMKEPTRESFYEALTSIKGLKTDFAFGPIDTTVKGSPAVQTVSLQKFNGNGYANVEVVG
ncbi:ABC transporter substrate-binding protein [Naasia aerilata]|uniref:ABC transporter substrate-binding protein n=1 Tax=Naasia aerilata TaxID=1162966 RepID=A0ABN6XMN0_9MICO|nr:ABC transporter substrate-binding protein [Naasia aerilata]